MSMMMSYKMCCRFDPALVELEAFGKVSPHLQEPGDVRGPIACHAAAGATGQSKDRSPDNLGTRITRDRNVIEVLGSDVGLVQAVSDCVDWKRGVVLDSGEALFFDGRHERAIHHDRGRSIAVIRVDAQDIHDLVR